jgi:hypothetical protein
MARKRLSTNRSTKSFFKAAKAITGTKSKAKKKTRNQTGKLVANRNIDQDGVTYSFLSEFLSDRESARLTYVEGWQETGMGSALEFGQLFHACLESTAANHNTLPNVTQVVNQTIKTRCEYNPLKKDELEQLKLLGEVVGILYPIYFNYWKQNKGIEFSKQASYVAQEESFEVTHQFSHYPFGSAVPITDSIVLRGRFDAIFRYNGRLWLMENKTKGQIDSEGLTASLTQDIQTMMYCHAIRLKYGECPAGVLYNVIKRPAHRFGVKDTTASYLGRIQDSVVASPNDYFMRWHVDIDESELEQWLVRTLNPILSEVKRWWDSIKHDPFNPWHSPLHFFNPESLYTKYGRSRYFDFHTRKSTYGLKRRNRPK